MPSKVVSDPIATFDEWTAQQLAIKQQQQVRVLLWTLSLAQYLCLKVQSAPLNTKPSDRNGALAQSTTSNTGATSQPVQTIEGSATQPQAISAGLFCLRKGIKAKVFQSNNNKRSIAPLRRRRSKRSATMPRKSAARRLSTRITMQKIATAS